MKTYAVQEFQDGKWINLFLYSGSGAKKQALRLRDSAKADPNVRGMVRVMDLSTNTRVFR